MDFEHWSISLQRMYGLKPDIKGWRDRIARDYSIQEIAVFADFSGTLGYALPSIREVTNQIIETQNPSPHYKKDFTDFIMLDYIYQKAMTARGIDTFIIFTGDGHFASVVRCLTGLCRKKVGIYAVKDALSNQLKSSATWYCELPTEEELLTKYYSVIVKNFEYLRESRNRKITPTFRTTVDAVSRHNHMQPEEVRAALAQMIDKGYIEQHEKKSRFQYTVKELSVNWPKLMQDGYWKPVQAATEHRNKR